MKHLKVGLLVILSGILGFSCNDRIEEKNAAFQPDKLMIRIAEIEVDSNYVDEYIAILKEESEASMRWESGVICIYPMFQKEDPTQIRILEIYASKAAYESHLQTPHFKHYKETTFMMVKDLKLIDIETIDTESMPKIFRKLN